MGSDNTVHTNSARSDRIRSWLGDKTGKYDMLLVLLLYIASVIVHYFIGSFPKRITTYNDELLYYTIAQSIHDGKGILCLNAQTSYNKIVYSFVLSPFFGIDDPVLRVNMITLFNSALIMTSLFFVYLISKELELNRGSMLLTLAIALVWPDLLYSVTFMSENLNWPLTLLAVFLWLKSKKSKRTVAYSIAFGAVCYIGYLCKDIFLALVLSTVVFEAAYPIVMFLINRKDDVCQKLGKYYDKHSLIGCGISIAVFAVCYVIGSALLYSGADSNAVGAIAGGLGNLKNNYAFLYLLYAFVYYLAASFIAVLVMPIAYSAASFKQMDKNTRGLFSFLILYLVISCAMISYTISIKEDIGQVFPRGHLRYLGFILLLLIVVFFKVLQDKNDTDEKLSRKQIIFTMAAAFFACMIFKGFTDGKASIDQSVLNVYHSAAEVLQAYTVKGGQKKFYIITLVSFAVFSVIIFLVYYYKNKRRSGRSAICIFSVFMLMLCVQNGRLEIAQYRSSYGTKKEVISNVLAINQYLGEANDAKQILYIFARIHSDEQKVFVTYFNHINKLCQCYEETLPSYTADGRVIDVPNTEFELNISNFLYTYNNFSGFDYIITDCNCDVELRGVSPIDEASGEFYTLYKNDDPAAVEIIPDAYAGERLEITFSGEDNNAEKFCKSGIEETPDGFPWTDRDRVSFKIPVLGEYNSVDVTISIAETYGNTPQQYIAVQKSDILSEGTLIGAGEISFTVPVKDNKLTFDLVCPTAIGKSDESELLIGYNNTRYAFRLNKMTVG